jgi:hypothetical protein
LKVSFESHLRSVDHLSPGPQPGRITIHFLTQRIPASLATAQTATTILGVAVAVARAVAVAVAVVIVGLLRTRVRVRGKLFASCSYACSHLLLKMMISSRMISC